MNKNPKIGIDGIYIVHGLKGYEQHEKHVNYWLGEKYQLSYKYVVEGDYSLQTDESLNRYLDNKVCTNMSKGEIACALNHILCYEQVINNNDKYALIMEDDPFFLGDFIRKIRRVVEQAGNLEQGFIISLENTTLRFPPIKKIKKGKYLYEASAGRCAGAYLIDQVAANNMLSELKIQKCNTTIDWWHNEIIKKGVVKMYWAHPPLTEQGSHNGRFNSLLGTRAKGYIPRIKWLIQKFYKLYIFRTFDY